MCFYTWSTVQLNFQYPHDRGDVSFIKSSATECNREKSECPYAGIHFFSLTSTILRILHLTSTIFEIIGISTPYLYLAVMPSSLIYTSVWLIREVVTYEWEHNLDDHQAIVMKELRLLPTYQKN